MSDFTTHFITANTELEKGNYSENFKKAFYFGVQGPDIFFYHTPLIGGSKGFKIGGSVHKKVPKELFEKDVDKLFERNDFYRGYYLGVMLHYYGDAIMHQYIGYLCKAFPKKQAHGCYERDVDKFLYEYKFNESVNKFNPKKFYKVDYKIAKEISLFWKEREGIDKSPLYIFVCMWKIANYNKLFCRAPEKLVNLLKKIQGDGESLTAHFKRTDNKDILNLNHEIWGSPYGQRDLSVLDIIDITIKDYEKKYEELLNDSFSFDDERTFECGC